MEDRRSLDNFIVGCCIRRSVLDEAFTWLPDPVAEALAKVTPTLMPLPPADCVFVCVLLVGINRAKRRTNGKTAVSVRLMLLEGHNPGPCDRFCVCVFYD